MAYRKGRDSCELQGGRGAPVTALNDVTINTAGCLIATDPHLTTRELAGILDISLGSVHTLLHDHLNVSRVCAHWIPCPLTLKQKKQHVTLCEHSSECVRKEVDRWWKTIITADGSWTYAYDPALKQQSTEWVKKGEGPPRKGRATKSTQKAMVITFFNYRGVVHTHQCRLAPKNGVDSEYYISVLKQLMKDHIPKKWLDLIRMQKLHHGNARPHVSQRVTEFLAHKQIQVVPHPLYSPDLAPNDFYLYPTAKKDLKGKHFPSADAAIKALEAILKRLLKPGFEHVFLDWQHC